MKKTFIVLVLECLVVLLILGIILFIFKIFPFNTPASIFTSQNTRSPISVDVQNVKSAKIVYQLSGVIKNIEPQSGGFYAVVFAESPKDKVFIASNVSIFLQNKPSAPLNIKDIRSGNAVTTYAIYDLKNKNWIAVPNVSIKPSNSIAPGSQ